MNQLVLYAMVRHLIDYSYITDKCWSCFPLTNDYQGVSVVKNGEEFLIRCGEYLNPTIGETAKINEHIDKRYFLIRIYPKLEGARIELIITEKGLKCVRKALREYVNSEERRIVDCLAPDYVGERLEWLTRSYRDKVDVLTGEETIELDFDRGK